MRHPVVPSPAASPPVLALALLACATAIGVAPPAAAAVHQVRVEDFLFIPDDLTIAPGDTVTWTNAQGTHNVVADNGSFTSGVVSGGAWTFSRTFASTGDFRYYCALHGSAGGLGMTGIVRVQGGNNGGQPGSLSFTTSGYSVNEGGTATITARRTGGDDGAVTVSYATGGGSATAGADYTPRSGTLSWANGDDNPKTFTVPTAQDTANEGDETVQLNLSNPTGGANLGAPATAVLTIRDDDGGSNPPGMLSLAASQVEVMEGAGTATLEVRRTNGTFGAVSARLTTGDGSASAGADYLAVSEVVSFGNGDATPRSVQVPLVDDVVAEGVETFHAMLVDPTGGASLGNPSMAMVTVLDDDVPIGPCVEDEFTHCFHDGRFAVSATFRAPGAELGQARRIPLTDQSGLYWFFFADNVEMLIKVLNACVDPFNRYWVFLAATTNVEFTVTVVDTQTPAVKVYRNDQGVAAVPIQDTDAFATCP